MTYLEVLLAAGWEHTSIKGDLDATPSVSKNNELSHDKRGGGGHYAPLLARNSISGRDWKQHQRSFERVSFG